MTKSGCWLWTGDRTAAGYGRLSRQGRRVYAHRFMFEQARGPIPSGLVLDHFHCSTPSCVNPDHLRPVTRRENNLRGESLAAIEASRTHCPQGHPLTGNNLLPYKRAKGHRECRECKRAADRERYARRGQ